MNDDAKTKIDQAKSRRAQIQDYFTGINEIKLAFKNGKRYDQLKKRAVFSGNTLPDYDPDYNVGIVTHYSIVKKDRYNRTAKQVMPKFHIVCEVVTETNAITKVVFVINETESGIELLPLDSDVKIFNSFILVPKHTTRDYDTVYNQLFHPF